MIRFFFQVSPRLINMHDCTQNIVKIENMGTQDPINFTLENRNTIIPF